MTTPLRLVLVGILASTIAAEVLWQSLARFDLDGLRLFGLLAAAAFTLGAAVICDRVKKYRRWTAMLYGAAFLQAFAPVCSVLTYFGISIAGPRIDDLLASVDRSMGVDWLGLVMITARHPALLAMFVVAYMISEFQVLMTVLILGWYGDDARIWRLCVAMAIATLASISFWVLYPSFGAYAVYHVPFGPDLPGLGQLAWYPKHLESLYANGPGRIDPTSLRGLIGFPSIHAEQMVISLWYLRWRRAVFVPAAVFGVIVAFATVIEGGHHVADLIGGAAAAAFGIFLSCQIWHLVKNNEETLLSLRASPR